MVAQAVGLRGSWADRRERIGHQGSNGPSPVAAAVGRELLPGRPTDLPAKPSGSPRKPTVLPGIPPRTASTPSRNPFLVCLVAQGRAMLEDGNDGHD